MLACPLSTPCSARLVLTGCALSSQLLALSGSWSLQRSKDARAFRALLQGGSEKIMGAQPANVDHEFPSSLTPLPSPGRASALPRG